MIRLKKLTIKNIKNTRYGSIDFFESANGGSMLGIYGQNGSGKTSVIDAAECMRLLMRGMPLPSGAADLLMRGERLCNFEFVFSFSDPGLFEDELVEISYGIVLADRAGEIKIENETLALNGEKRNKRNLISYSVHSAIEDGGSSENFVLFEPSGRWKSIMASSRSAAATFSASGIASFDLDKSFIFSEGFRNSLASFISVAQEKRTAGKAPGTLQTALPETLEPLRVIVGKLCDFAHNDMVVINQKHEAVIPLGLMLLSSGQATCGSRGFVLDLDNPAPISAEHYSSLCSALDVSNLVLKRLIPGIEVEAYKLGDRVLDSGEAGVEFELLSNRNGTRVPLRCESTGIQKVVSILGALIASYNNPDACIFIDEFDSGVFEYLLGELLEVMEPRMKGQLVFTAHNLRPLEKLPLQSLVFTTSNPSNRFVRFKGLHGSNNVRSQYYKSIVLGGQNETLYQPTDKSLIAAAFSEAGHPGEDLDFSTLLQRYRDDDAE